MSDATAHSWLQHFVERCTVAMEELVRLHAHPGKVNWKIFPVNYGGQKLHAPDIRQRIGNLLEVGKAIQQYESLLPLFDYVDPEWKNGNGLNSMLLLERRESDVGLAEVEQIYTAVIEVLRDWDDGHGQAASLRQWNGGLLANLKWETKCLRQTADSLSVLSAKGEVLRDFGNDFKRSRPAHKSVRKEFLDNVSLVLDMWQLEYGRVISDNIPSPFALAKLDAYELHKEVLHSIIRERAGTVAVSAKAVGKLERWAGSQGSKNLAVVFTDIIDGTRLNKQHGDKAWKIVIDAHYDQARRYVAAKNGCLVKTIGDAVLAVFHNSMDALNFALEFERQPGHPLIPLRVGVHIGQVEVSNEDISGAEVNLAKRVCDKAKIGGIWVSDRVHADWIQHHAQGELKWDDAGLVQLKGFSPHHLWSLPPSSPTVLTDELTTILRIQEIKVEAIELLKRFFKWAPPGGDPASISKQVLTLSDQVNQCSVFIKLDAVKQILQSGEPSLGMLKRLEAILNASN